MGCDLKARLVFPPENRPFSILERIEWAATASAADAERTARHLSVSSNGSNGLRLMCLFPPCCTLQPFQYPRTDRMGCDHHSANTRRWQKLSFSILERIEWAATSGACLVPPTRYHLSVSSNGSNGLRQRRPPCSRFRYPLSVSSNGSNGLRR